MLTARINNKERRARPLCSVPYLKTAAYFTMSFLATDILVIETLGGTIDSIWREDDKIQANLVFPTNNLKVSLSDLKTIANHFDAQDVVITREGFGLIHITITKSEIQ